VGGLIFGFTSTVGAALWASDLEMVEKKKGDGGEPRLQEKEVELEDVTLIQ
jgi:hypothetical protein